MASEGKSSYRPEIDGLRTIAVVPVVLFHMGYRWMNGGWAGVDVFFVISGFLITGIIARELDLGTFSFRGFWGRRVRRIFPAMIVTTVATLAVVWTFGFRPDRPLLGRQGAAALLCVANLYFWRTTGDYWGSEAEQSPFLHYWSLSVEEQFYLFYPFVLWLIAKIRPRWLEPVLIAAFILSIVAFLYGVQHHPSATFYLLPTRAWELTTGGLIALALRGVRSDSLRSPSISTLAMGGLGMIAASCLLLPTLGGGVAFAVVGAALVLAFAQSGPAYAILAAPPIVHIGKLSYSIYLVHWPVLVLADHLGVSRGNPALLAPIYLLSLASYRLVEMPTRHRRRVVAPIFAAYIATVGLAAVVILGPSTYDTSAFARPRSFMFYYSLSPSNEVGSTARRLAASMDLPERTAPADAYRTGGIMVGPPGPPRVVLIGDSHGVFWSDPIRVVAERLGVPTALISVNGVPPFVSLPIRRDQQSRFLTPEQKYEYDTSRLDLIKKWRPDVAIVATRWSAAHVTDESVSDLLNFLSQNVKRVLLIEEPPQLAGLRGRPIMQWLAHQGVRPLEGVERTLPMDILATSKGRAKVRAIAARYPNCGVFETDDHLTRGDGALVLDGRDVLYFDFHHLTDQGARLALPRFEREIGKIVRGGAASSDVDAPGASHTPRAGKPSGQ